MSDCNFDFGCNLGSRRERTQLKPEMLGKKRKLLEQKLAISLSLPPLKAVPSVKGALRALFGMEKVGHTSGRHPLVLGERSRNPLKAIGLRAYPPS